MATVKYDGHELPVVEDWRLGELIEAENALGQDMETAKGGGKMALIIFISIRRARPEIPVDALAGQIMRMELTALSGDEEAAAGGESPLGDDTDEDDEASASSETDGRRTSGLLRSAS